MDADWGYLEFRMQRAYIADTYLPISLRMTAIC